MNWGGNAVLGLIFASCAVPAQAFFHRDCPDAAALDDGIVYTDPARVGAFDIMYRRLDGPLIGKVTIGSPFPGRQPVTYAGQFTYRSWSDGVLRQWEEPQTDLSPLLRFEPGTELPFETIRYGQRGDTVREWRTVGTYKVAAAPEFQLGTCAYDAVDIQRDGTLFMPDGSTKPDRERFTYVPELMLRIEGTFI